MSLARRIVFLLLAVMLVMGCQGAPTVTPAPGSRPTTASQPGQPSTPTGLPAATATPAFTPTPMPPHAPRLVDRIPARGEEQLVDAPIALTFDQKMDTASVEAAWAITPTVKGAFTWQEATILTFTPEKPGLDRDTAYQVSVGVSAKNALGMALEQSVQFSLHTVGYLEVAGVFPAADSEQVETNTAIRIVFDRPVVPLASIAEQANLLAPLTFEPAVEGQGEWINTATYSFRPKAQLKPGAQYQVTAKAGLADAIGGVLAEDYVWDFTTQSPAIVQVIPADASTNVSPDTGVRIAFNTAMSLDETQKRFTLTTGKPSKPVAGMFSWEGQTLVFTPTARLELGAVYAAEIKAGAPSQDGSAQLGKGQRWSFETASAPRIVSVLPRDGQTNVSLGAEMEIDFGSPMKTEQLEKQLSITPTVTFWTYWTEDDTIAHVSTYLRPSTRYTATLKAGIEGRYGDKTPQAKTWSFLTGPYPPSIALETPGIFGTYSSYSQPRLYVDHRNVSKVTVSLYALTPEQFLEINRDSGYPTWDKVPATASNLVRKWSLPVEAPLNALRAISVTLAEEDGAPLAPGFYYVRATAPEADSEVEHLLAISPYNLTLKNNETTALVWATDLKSGLPVGGVKLSFYDKDVKQIAQVTTDKDGLASAEFVAQDPWSPLMVIGEGDGGLAAVSRWWSDGIAPWNYNIETAWQAPKTRAHLFTERRIYRPGQTVYFKGIFRADNDGSYTMPPAGTKVRVTALDTDGREFYQQELSLSDVGSLDGQFILGENAPLGYYGLRAELGEEVFDASFEVHEYRKPEFQVSVALDQDDYIQGDKMRATAEASYFFGGPVQQARVTWRVNRAPYSFDRYQGEGWWSWEDWDDVYYGPSGEYGEFVTEGSGETDAEGRFEFVVPVDISKNKQSQRYTLEVSVVDVNNQEVTARGGAIAHKGAFYIGLASEQYVGAAGEPQKVRILTLDTQGITHTQQALTVSLAKIEWYSVQEETPGGGFYWTNKISETVVTTQTLTTDKRGLANATFTPKEGGTYRVRAVGLDEAENEVRSALYLWVSDAGWVNWGQEDNDRIQLVADKKEYKVGDTAKILVPSPYQGKVKALLTVERGGVLSHQILDLTRNSETIKLPIEETYAPNVFVSLLMVQGASGPGQVASFKLGYVQLNVSTERQKLDVTVTPDKQETYTPRSQATFQIETKDYAGKGVPAEVTLQLVDLAVETLVGGAPPNIMDTFYRKRGLGISTATTLVYSVDRINQTIAEEGKGGGGGDGGDTAREIFPDTAYWAASVKTDAQGKASVTVDLPDNLTTWRMRAQAVTADTRVGDGLADIVTSLGLMVRPMAPRFGVIGDQPMLGAVIHNNTAQAMSVAVKLEGDGVTIEQTEQTVQVPAGGREAIQWTASVGAGPEMELRYSAHAGSLTDAVTIRLPVYHPSSPETVGTSGVVADRLTEWVRLPENADPQLGELAVILEPSLAASMQEGLDYLTAYPYDCIEQTVSRFLPNVFTYRALQSLDIEQPKLEEKLPQQVAVGLQRLYALQNSDGGWGWWQREASSASLTGYVLLSLVEAKRAGFVVNDAVISNAIAFLDQWLDQGGADVRWLRDERAFVLYALAEADAGDLGRTVKLYGQRADMSLYAKAYLAMTLRLLDPEEKTRLQTLTNEFANAAQLTSTGAHWQEAEESFHWTMNTDTRTTAVILRALVLIQPENPLLPNVVRWLLSARSTGRWETTQENAWAILALTDYLVATGELKGAMEYALEVNGTERASGKVTPGTAPAPQTVHVPVSQLVAGADNAVTLSQDGEGKLYYSAFLQYYLPAEELKALQRGVYVDRQYTLVDNPKRPITSARVNDLVQVKLTLVAPNDLYYLVLEDPLPAGCEALDPSLATSRSVDDSMLKTENEYDQQWWNIWNWVPAHSELRDEKLALFATQLPKGAYEYTYTVRCTTEGSYKVLPVTAYEMYAPDVFGRSAGAVFEVDK